MVFCRLRGNCAFSTWAVYCSVSRPIFERTYSTLFGSSERRRIVLVSPERIALALDNDHNGFLCCGH